MSGLSDRELIQLFDGLSSNSSIKALGLGQLFTNVKPKYAVVLSSLGSLMVLFSSHVLGLERQYWLLSLPVVYVQGFLYSYMYLPFLLKLISRTWCKVIVTTLFYITSCKRFAPSPRYAYSSVLSLFPHVIISKSFLRSRTTMLVIEFACVDIAPYVLRFLCSY